MSTEVEDNGTDPDAPSEARITRARLMRERQLQRQAIEAKKARIAGTGGKPSASEIARMVEEFRARGGQITVCPAAAETWDGKGKTLPDFE